MSIEQLQEDLKELIKRAAPAPSGSALSAEEKVDAVWSFVNGDLLPWMENLVEEVGEMDAAVYAAVQGTEDVLHSDSAALFTGLIASGAVLIRELETRIGNDHRISVLIKEYKEVSKECTALLQEITIPDDEDEEGDEDEPAAPEGDKQ